MDDSDSKSPSLWECLDHDASDTLFLNRDGVILAPRDPSHLISTAGEVVFQPRFLVEAPKLAQRYKQIFVIGSYRPDHAPTRRQQQEVDDYIKARVGEAGGRIDGIYTEWCDPKLQQGVSGSPLLPLLVRRNHPTINFAKSIMVGSTDADRMLAYNCGMRFMTLKPDFDIDTLVDFSDIEANLNSLRGMLLSEIEMLYKFMNSEPRIRAIRLMSRSIINTLAVGGKLIVVLADDCGLCARNVARYFDFSAEGGASAQPDIIEQRSADATAGGIAARAKAHDVVIIFTVEGKWRELGEIVAAAQRCDAITVSVTGAKPMRADSSDLLLKVPTTSASQVQTAFLLIVDMLQSMVRRHASDAPGAAK